MANSAYTINAAIIGVSKPCAYSYFNSASAPATKCTQFASEKGSRINAPDCVVFGHPVCHRKPDVKRADQLHENRQGIDDGNQCCGKQLDRREAGGHTCQCHCHRTGDHQYSGVHETLSSAHLHPLNREKIRDYSKKYRALLISLQYCIVHAKRCRNPEREIKCPCSRECELHRRIRHNDPLPHRRVSRER